MTPYDTYMAMQKQAFNFGSVAHLADDAFNVFRMGKAVNNDSESKLRQGNAIAPVA